MTSPLDMALDDLIKNNKKPSSAPSSGTGNRGRVRGRGGAGGPARRFSGNRSANRSAPYFFGKAPDIAWQHDLYAGQIASGYPAPAAKAPLIETGVKLHISNLDYGVSNEDIKELFSEVGDLKSYSINYDRSGRSKGTAEVILSRRIDALAAISRYNNVQLDGKPMKIELVVPDIPPPSAPPLNSNGRFGNPNAISKSGIGRPSGGWSRGGRGGGDGRGRGRGRGRGKPRNEPVSAAALDADLEKYHSEAMQTN